MEPDNQRSNPPIGNVSQNGNPALVSLTPRFRAKSNFLRWFQESAAFIMSPEGRQQLQATVFNGRSGFGAAGVGTLLLMLWDAKLVFSTGAGIGTMVLLYLLQDQQWRKEKLPELNQKLQHQLEGINQPFLWSAIGGGGAAFLSYLAIAAWAETDSHWLATGILIQGLLTCGVLGLGIRQSWRSKAEDIETLEFSHWVEKLSHEDPVARLLAVRQLTATVPSLTQQKELLEYFQLMVSHEPESLVREAVWQALEALSPNLNLLIKMDDAAPMVADRPETMVADRRVQAKIKAWVEPEELS
jgi:hypothetical protein